MKVPPPKTSSSKPVYNKWMGICQCVFSDTRKIAWFYLWYPSFRGLALSLLLGAGLIGLGAYVNAPVTAEFEKDPQIILVTVIIGILAVLFAFVCLLISGSKQDNSNRGVLILSEIPFMPLIVLTCEVLFFLPFLPSSYLYPLSGVLLLSLIALIPPLLQIASCSKEADDRRIFQVLDLLDVVKRVRFPGWRQVLHLAERELSHFLHETMDAVIHENRTRSMEKSQGVRLILVAICEGVVLALTDHDKFARNNDDSALAIWHNEKAGKTLIETLQRFLPEVGATAAEAARNKHSESFRNLISPIRRPIFLQEKYPIECWSLCLDQIIEISKELDQLHEYRALLLSNVMQTWTGENLVSSLIEACCHIGLKDKKAEMLLESIFSKIDKLLWLVVAVKDHEECSNMLKTLRFCQNDGGFRTIRAFPHTTKNESHNWVKERVSMTLFGCASWMLTKNELAYLPMAAKLLSVLDVNDAATAFRLATKNEESILWSQSLFWLQGAGAFSGHLFHLPFLKCLLALVCLSSKHSKDLPIGQLGNLAEEHKWIRYQLKKAIEEPPEELFKQVKQSGFSVYREWSELERYFNSVKSV
jgi:hypothetical protein